MGADDLTIPSFVCSLSRLSWIILLGIFWVASHQVENSCSKHVYVFTAVGIAIYSVTLITYFSMLVVSCRGTVLEVEKRWCMAGLFQFLVVVILCEGALVVYGTNISIESDTECARDLNISFTVMRFVVALSWVDLCFSSCCGCIAVAASTRDDEAIKRGWYMWGDATAATPIAAVAPAPPAPSLSRPASSASLLGGDDEAQDQYEFSLEEERQTDADQAFLLGTFPSSHSHELVEDNDDLSSFEQVVDDDDALEKSTKTWRRRIARVWTALRCLTCGLFGTCSTTPDDNTPTDQKKRDPFQEFAVILAGWFQNLDLVPSDIMAALFLMRAEQREMESTAVKELQAQRNNNHNNNSRFHASSNRHRAAAVRRGNIPSVARWMWTTNGPASRANHILHAQQIRASRDARITRSNSSFYSPSSTNSGSSGDVSTEELDPEAKALLEHAMEIMPYMIGMYGWFWFSYMNGFRAWLKLCCCGCSARKRRRTGDEEQELLFEEQEQTELHAKGDGCCHWNTTALVDNVSRGTEARGVVVYASFTTLVGQRMPYSVSVDHNQRRVVVSVRGTLTLADCLAHGSMVPAPLAPHAKRWGFEDEIDVDSYCHAGILKVATWMRQDLEQRDVLHKLFGISTSTTQSEYPDCRGYSLELTGHSLGAGVAVVLSLFLRPAFPSVRCTAFAPPGGVFDWKLSNRCSAWVNSVFVGEDFVPRLSWHALFKLRAQILDTLRRDKANKFFAVFSSWYGRTPISQLLYKTDQVPDSEHTRRMQKKIDDLATARKTSLLDSVRLYAPGKLLHLMKAETVRSKWYLWCFCCGSRSKVHYVPMWVDDRATLDEILLSPNMALDHFPAVFDSVLREVIAEYCS